MTIDVEAGGALATAALVANEIDAPAAHANPHTQTCANCHAVLAGQFCHECGQAAHVHRSLLHIVEETLHGVLHFDTRSWRTLPLLLGRPGLLTRRYIDGQRVRYVSPLALFLFTVFLMFFVLSFINHDHGAPSTSASSEAERAAPRAQLTQQVNAAQQRVEKLQAELTAAGARVTEDQQAALKESQEEQKAAESALTDYNAALALVDAPPEKNTDRVVIRGSKGLADLNVQTGYPKFDAALRHAAENPELLLYKMKNTAYKFSFMLIPISLPFMWLMFFWQRGAHLYDHAVFILYSLSFMSLFFILIAIMGLSSVTSGFIGYALLLPPIHMYLQLRETYRLGNFSTLWRTAVLLLVAALVFILFIVMIVGLSAT